MTAPVLEISQTREQMHVRAEFPGLSAGEIEIVLNDAVLTIRTTTRDGVALHRALRLPSLLDADQVKACFDKGVLSVTVHRTRPHAGSQRIVVRTTEPSQEAAEGWSNPTPS